MTDISVSYLKDKDTLIIALYCHRPKKQVWESDEQAIRGKLELLLERQRFPATASVLGDLRLKSERIIKGKYHIHIFKGAPEAFGEIKDYCLQNSIRIGEGIETALSPILQQGICDAAR